MISVGTISSEQNVSVLTHQHGAFEDILSVSSFTFINQSIASYDFISQMPNTSSEAFEELANNHKHHVIGVVLAVFSFITVLGNLLVITSVVKELYLRTVTNYLIVSLAIADVMVGGIVMPFSISYELNDNVWYYGTIWCDLWHSFDVLGSTASILNLCIISLDRYWAITDPIAYPSRMSPTKVGILITLAWLCSAGISFPAIAWWKTVTKPELPSTHCVFTEDSAYLIISSLVSFYFPTIVMIFVYIQIYKAARNQTKSIETGTKVLTSSRLFGPSGVMTLRIHRGGMAQFRSQNVTPDRALFQQHISNSDEEDMSQETSSNQTPVHSAALELTHDGIPCTNSQTDNHHNYRPMTFITKRLRHFALSKKLSKLAKEQKAAKTLGIVVGVFIICWLPFFVINVLIGICSATCVRQSEIIIPVFTWFGYINSGVNPIIYALSMRDFRRAFGRILFCCYPRYRFYQSRRRQKTYRSNLTTASFIGSALL